MRGQFSLLATARRATVTGSLSHGERAGVRGQFGLFPQPGAYGYWLPLPRGEGWGGASLACSHSRAPTVTGSLSHGERAGVRGQFSLSHSRAPCGYWLPLPQGEGWGEGPVRPVRTAGRPTVTGSLSHGERAGVRGQFALFPQPGALRLLAPSPTGRGLG